jgi:hypothetical protein
VGVRLFVGAHAARIQGERQDLSGDRCFTAAHWPRFAGLDVGSLNSILDSGAFSDPPEKRLTPEGALDRQLEWERRASERWGTEYRANVLVSYDRLIDETWTMGERRKSRWSVQEADGAVEETVEAARYLASKREELSPRTLMLSCQGVDALQYEECTRAVLEVAQPGDWIGLGGWCILGRWQTWLPEFWATLYRVLPLISSKGIENVHILGVLWRPALGGLLWLADQYDLRVSTDSAAPILACTWKGDYKFKKSGARAPYWRDNVNWWIEELANLRGSIYYRRPPFREAARQAEFWEMAV